MERRQKSRIYAEVESRIRGVLEGSHDAVSAMSSVCSLLHEALPFASWTGFYRLVTPDLLRVGPYQGPVACLEIPVGRGVCGTAAAERRSQVVADVHSFPGHIACDPRAASEIVVPVLGPDGELRALLDLDSHQPEAFDEVDREALESVVRMLQPHLGSSPQPTDRAQDSRR